MEKSTQEVYLVSAWKVDVSLIINSLRITMIYEVS